MRRRSLLKTTALAAAGHVVEAGPGEFVHLAEMGTRHWQYGGPEGAIVTEVGNYHTNGSPCFA